jgi:succinylglutamic semialdehyde dehydrogenase
MNQWINGEWIAGLGARRIKKNPVSNETVWQGNDAAASQVGLACEAARAAFPAWANWRLASARRLSKNSPHCWKPTKPH